MAKKIKSHSTFSVEIEDGLSIELGMKRLEYDEGAALRARYTEAHSKAGEEREALWGPLVLETIRDYVRCAEPLEFEVTDGTVELKTGADLVVRFGGSPGVLNEIFSGAMLASALTPRQKKALLSRIATSPSSEEPEREAPGPKPETTATSAGNGASAETEAATDPGTTTSGSTDLQEKTDAPSSRSKSAQSNA